MVTSTPAGDWSTVRLHVVSGKGGTGKTTVAAAMAIALATGGHRVLLIEVEGRQGVARLFDTPPLPYSEERIAVAPGGGEVLALAIDPEAALLDYLELFYKMGRAGSALRRLGAIDFATTIAPGLRDVLLTGKVAEAVVRRKKDGRFDYDAVVLDAPPTGRISRFLNVTSEVAGLTRFGPIKNQSDSVMRVISSSRTAVHLVALLEEMPVQETLDGFVDLKRSGLPLGAAVVNMIRDPGMSDARLAAAVEGRLSRDELRAGLRAASLPPHVNLDTAVEALLVEAADLAGRVELERAEYQRLKACGRPLYELPLLAGGVDVAGLYKLAALLRKQGFA